MKNALVMSFALVVFVACFVGFFLAVGGALYHAGEALGLWP